MAGGLGAGHAPYNTVVIVRFKWVAEELGGAALHFLFVLRAWSGGRLVHPARILISSFVSYHIDDEWVAPVALSCWCFRWHRWQGGLSAMRAKGYYFSIPL